MARKPELYRWKSAIPDPNSDLDFSYGGYGRENASSKRNKKSDEIADWMKTVEAASDRAISDVFGASKPSRKPPTKPRDEVTTVNVREHEAAYAEAQDLLNEWMKDKISFEPEEFDYIDEYRGPTQSEIRQQWDDLLQQDHYKVDEEPKRIEYNFDLEREDTDDIVDEILENLMKKEVVRKEVKKDLGLNRQEIFQGPDPRTKMQLRHEQVKENREKREKERREKMEEKMKQRDVHLKAKQIVVKEEKEKQQKHRHEELLVQKEVAKLRRVMMEQRRVEEEKKQKQLLEEERLRYEAEMELERQQWEEAQRDMDMRLESKKKRRDMEVVRTLQAKMAAKDLKVLQRAFSGWYNVVLDRRLQFGKVGAMADWKLLVRAFNAWKSYVRHNRIDRETQLHNQHMKEHVRKTQLASRHYELTLLKRCLSQWQVFINQAITSRDTEREREQTKNKMASFLEAASSGRLFNEKKADEEKVEALFTDQTRQLTKRPDSSRSTTSRHSARSVTSLASPTRSKSDTNNRRISDPPNRPIQAWQVTKKHLDMTPDQIREMGQGEGHPSPTEENSPQRKREIHHRMHKWASPPEAGVYENRHKAQQEILKLQREQLKEQQKMIEDLKFMQTQQMLQQQLQQQQLETQRLNNTPVEKVPLKKPQSARKPATPTSVHTEASTVNGDTTDRGQLTTARTDVTSDSTSRSKVSAANGRHDEFVRKMEERAAERVRLKEERERKKREQEQERLARLEEEQAEQRQREEEEKLARLEAKKEMKRLEKQREIEKQQFQEHLKVMTSRADEHYCRSQLKYRGLLPWKQYLDQCGHRLRTARWHYESRITRLYFHEWRRRAENSLREKQIRSERFHEMLLVRRCFTGWRRLRLAKTWQQARADSHYRRTLLWKVLQTWTEFATDEKLKMWRLERIAKEHDLIRLQKRTFLAWRKLPSLEAEERAREKRRAEMRAKVACMLPDFQKSVDETVKVTRYEVKVASMLTDFQKSVHETWGQGH